MVRYGSAVKAAIEFGRRSGALASGESFVRKYAPPGQRDSLVKVIRAFEQAATGAGLYTIINSFMGDEITPGNAPQVPFNGSSPYSKDKTRSGSAKRSSGRYNKYRRSNRNCRCPRSGKYKRSNYR